MKVPADRMKIKVGDHLKDGIVTKIINYPYWHPYSIKGYVIQKDGNKEFIRNIDITEKDWRENQC